MANSEVKGDILTTLTIDSAVLTLFMAVEVSGDINVKFARAAVTNKNVSSLPFRRESPRIKISKSLKDSYERENQNEKKQNENYALPVSADTIDITCKSRL